MIGHFSAPSFLVTFATLACVQVPGEVLSLEQSRAPGHDSLEETALETTIQSLPSSSSEKGNSEKSPLVTPSAASLADSVTQGREGRSCGCGQGVPKPHEGKGPVLAVAAWLSCGAMFLQQISHNQSPLLFAGSSKQRPSRVQSLVSSQGSMDSDHLGESAGAGVPDSVQADAGSDVIVWGHGELCACAGVTPEDRACEWP